MESLESIIYKLGNLVGNSCEIKDLSLEISESLKDYLFLHEENLKLRECLLQMQNASIDLVKQLKERDAASEIMHEMISKLSKEIEGYDEGK